MLTWHNQVLEGTQATPVTLNTAQVAGKGCDSCGTRGSHVNNNAFTCRLFKTHPMCVTYRCSVWTRIFDVPDKRVVLTPHCSRVLHHGPNPPRARDGPEGHDHLTCAPCKNDAYHRGIASRTMTPRTPQRAFSSVGHHASPTPAPTSSDRLAGEACCDRSATVCRSALINVHQLPLGVVGGEADGTEKKRARRM
jgi:hypothetical protein